MSLSRKLRYGMVGGGPGAFIGDVHRKAAALDGLTTLVAGAFSSNPAKSRQQGEALHLDPARVYGSFEEMAEREAALPDDERIDFVSIVTPNFMHFPVAKAFIERGIHVVCDKPMTTTVEEAEKLCRLVAVHDVVFALTHNYTGYPMVKQARAMVQNGELGEIHKVVVEYPQGWLATKLEDTGSKQAEWRTDPSKAGVSSAVGDIGSHAENLARYITGLEIESLCADIHTFVPGTGARGRRQHADPLQGRSAGRVALLPDFRRGGERLEHPCLRRERLPRMGAGESELPALSVQ